MSVWMPDERAEKVIVVDPRTGCQKQVTKLGNVVLFSSSDIWRAKIGRLVYTVAPSVKVVYVCGTFNPKLTILGENITKTDMRAIIKSLWKGGCTIISINYGFMKYSLRLNRKNFWTSILCFPSYLYYRWKFR